MSNEKDIFARGPIVSRHNTRGHGITTSVFKLFLKEMKNVRPVSLF